MLSTLVDFMDLVTFSLKKQNQPRWELCTPLFVLHDFLFFSFPYGQMKKKSKLATLIELCTLLPICGFVNKGGCLLGQIAKVK